MGGDFGDDEVSLPSGWVRKPLVECTTDGIISYGIVQPGADCLEGVPIVRVNNFSKGYLDGTDHLRVDPKIETKFSRTRLKGGEVLLTLVGSTGQSAIVPKEMEGWNVARAIAVIRASSDVGANWIELCLNSRETKHFLDSRANTTVQKTLNLKDVRNIPIRIPPEPIRRGIESISVTLNRKIELNRQTNETLEAMAQAMFKSWFVDFDPVIDNALAAGNDIPEPFQARAAARQALGDERKPLPEEIRREFPDEFVFSDEMGWVPRGWGVGTLEDHAEIVMGHSPKGESYNADGIGVPLVNGPVEFGSYFTSKIKWTTEPTRMSKINDLIVCVRGSTTGRYVKSNGEYCLGRGVCAVRGRSSQSFVDNLFYFSLRENLLIATGSTFPSWSGPAIKGFPAIVPESFCIAAYDEVGFGLSKRRSRLWTEIESLSDIRDTLLPKLLSGRLTIPNAEKLVAEAL